MPIPLDTSSSDPPTPLESDSDRETYDILEDISDFSSGNMDTPSDISMDETDRDDNIIGVRVPPKTCHRNYLTTLMDKILEIVVVLSFAAVFYLAFLAFGLPFIFFVLYTLFYSGVYFINKYFSFALTVVYFGVDLVDKYLPFVPKVMAYTRSLNARSPHPSPRSMTSSSSRSPFALEWTIFNQAASGESPRPGGFDLPGFAISMVQCLCATIIAYLLVTAFESTYLSTKRSDAQHPIQSSDEMKEINAQLDRVKKQIEELGKGNPQIGGMGECLEGLSKMLDTITGRVNVALHRGYEATIEVERLAPRLRTLQEEVDAARIDTERLAHIVRALEERVDTLEVWVREHDYSPGDFGVFSLSGA